MAKISKTFYSITFAFSMAITSAASALNIDSCFHAFSDIGHSLQQVKEIRHSPAEQQVRQGLSQIHSILQNLGYQKGRSWREYGQTVISDGKKVIDTIHSLNMSLKGDNALHQNLGSLYKDMSSAITNATSCVS